MGGGTGRVLPSAWREGACREHSPRDIVMGWEGGVGNCVLCISKWNSS